MGNSIRANIAILVVTLICTVAVVVMTFGHGSAGATRSDTPSTLDAIKQRGSIRVGWGGYPPYVSNDPVTHAKSGFSVDLINAIVSTWGQKIEVVWVETSWDRMLVDLKSNKFDLMVEPMFQTVPRAAEVDFSMPYSYFGYAVAIVKADDTRFSRVEDINTPGITVAVAQGVSDHEYAKQNLTAATLRVLPEGGIEAALTEVLLGRADVGLGDFNTVRRFAAAHEGKVKTLFSEAPPGLAPVGFMFRQDDFKFARFMDISLLQMETSGEIKRLAIKHKVPYLSTAKRMEYPE
jgi:ABC-type amino acid transport substrate-binding protein